MKLIKKLIRKRFQENCAFVFILFQIRIYVHLQCLVPGSQQTMCLVQSATDGTKLPLMRNSTEILVE